MKGFKSFADKTGIDFENGVTCVVGPNGSGKSNITDAIRWVLGEQKVKTLRGSKMEDVIFNGTSHRKPLGYAEVSLIFDNRDNILPIDYQEVNVTRKVFRSGESQYIINGAHCRLKDIRDLFMDTGIGIDGYSMIGQGKIDSILSNKKDDRRQIFDEASEIVKFKNRKNEAVKKLNNTEENLIRVNDIVSELESRVEPLRKEKEKASKYLEFADRLKYLEINSFIMESQTIKEKLDEIAKDISDFENNNIKSIEELNRKKISFQDLEVSKNEKSSVIDDLTRKINLMMEEISAIKSGIEISAERISSCNREITGNKEEIELSVRRKNSFEEELKDIESSVKDLEVTLGDKEGLEKKYVGEIDSLKEDLKKLESSAEGDKSLLVEILNKNERNKSDIENYKKMYKEFYDRSCQLSNDINSLAEKIQVSQSSLEEEIKRRDSIESSLSEYNNKKDNVLSEKLTLETRARNLGEEIADEKNKLTEARARLKVLENMERNFEGFNRSVKSLMKYVEGRNDSSFHGVVGKLIETPKKFETAIEVALGGAVQNVVCDSYDDAKRYIEYLKKTSSGRVTFLPRYDLKYRVPTEDFSNTEGVLGWGSQLVNYSSEYKRVFEYLLGNVLVMDTYDNALKLIRGKKIRYRVVTLSGEVLTSSGTVTGGSMNKKSSNSIIRRSREIKELSKYVSETTVKLKEQIAIYNKDTERLRNIDSEISSLDKDINNKRMEKLSCDNEISNYNVLLSGSKEQTDKLSGEKNIVEERIRNILDNISSLELDIKINEDNYQSYRSNIERFSTEIGELQDKISKKTEELYSYRIEVAKIKEQNQSQNSRFASIKKDISVIDTSIEGREEAISGLLLKVKELEKETEILNEKLIKGKEDFEKLQNDIGKRKEELQKIEEEIRNTDISIKKLDEELLNQEKIKNKKEIAKAKLETKFENFVQNLWEKYEIAYLEAFEMKDENFDHENAEKEIKGLRIKIKGLGDVNVNAIQEYDQVKERYEFLTEQRKDLIDSKKSLMKIIGDLEDQMIDQFKVKFEQIKIQFTTVFQDLFGGGRADLIIKDEDNILDSDIEIIAQPPGKKLQSINLMSGGEKALTAISLLFAILKIKPTPFCILDEIEAALDDVNVFRFSEFLREFSSKSQFVVITHRKGTMEIADVLYGVTMEEFGISKLLSLKLENIEEEIEYA
jgi:chromosome segregation protein